MSVKTNQETRSRSSFFERVRFSIYALIILQLLSVRSAQCQIIPSNRTIDWSQVGVPGGVPNRTTIYRTLSSIDNTGVTDVSSAIQSALNSCPADQVVLLPAGTYQIGSSITIPNHVVLRGAGPSTTTLTCAINYPIQFYKYFAWSSNKPALAADAHKGDGTISLASIPSDLQTGMKVEVTETNGAFIGGGIENGPNKNCMGQWVEISSINNTAKTITFNPPLYADYSVSLNAFLYYPVLTTNRNFVEYAGVENLKIVNSNPGSLAMIQFAFAAYCWLKNVETVNAGVSHLWAFDSFRCEIRDSFFHGVAPPLTPSRGYGLQLGTPNGSNPTSKPTAMLVENNIFGGNRGNIFIGYGTSGCVFGYNYFASGVFLPPTILVPDVIVHSSYPIMNLLEGNVGYEMIADNYHGPGATHTFFRNWLRGKALDTVSNLKSIEIDRLNENFNAVGNVLGYSGITTDVTSLANPAGQSAYQSNAPAAPLNYQNSYTCWFLGYVANNGATSAKDYLGNTISYDPNVATSLLRAGNYDYVSNQTKWDPGIPSRTLPASLYLSQKPGWWPSGTPWPPIGPDLTPMTSAIPAQIRTTSIIPSPPTNLRIVP